jgi:hypothetical protein
VFARGDGDIERELLFALEKCEQMLALLREERHRGSDRADREVQKLGESLELLQDLSPRTGTASPDGSRSSTP